jgi:hypothetical protein
MSAIFRRTPSGCHPGETQGNSRNRHKRYSVPPEARGKGYEVYGIPGVPASLRRRESSAPDAGPETKVLAEHAQAQAPAAAPPLATVAAEWAKVSEKGTSSLAARNALRVGERCVLLLTLLFLFLVWQVLSRMF